MDRKIVARGVLTSRVSGAGSTQAARTPVTFAVAAQAGRCQVLTLTLNDLQLSLLGLNVDLSEVNLRIFAVRRGPDSGILGRLFCALSNATVRLGRGASVAHAQKVVSALNSRLRDHPMRAFHADAVLRDQGDASAAQAAPSCQVLRLVLGPLDLNLLGLVVAAVRAEPECAGHADDHVDPGRWRPGRPVLRLVRRSQLEQIRSRRLGRRVLHDARR